MAKEKFVRDKPHVNIGTVSTTLIDTAGNLTFDGNGSTVVGNLAPSTVLTFSAPASLSTQTVTVAYPFDMDFFIDPAVSGEVTSIEFAIDVLPSIVDASTDLHVTLAILQDEAFIAGSHGQSTGQGASWVRLSDSGLRAIDFSAADGGPERPDFTRDFQFGYAITAEYSSSPLNVEVALDNMQVGIFTVPEPSSLILVISLGASLLWSRFWSGADDSS